MSSIAGWSSAAASSFFHFVITMATAPIKNCNTHTTGTHTQIYALFRPTSAIYYLLYHIAHQWHTISHPFHTSPVWKNSFSSFSSWPHWSVSFVFFRLGRFSLTYYFWISYVPLTCGSHQVISFHTRAGKCECDRTNLNVTTNDKRIAPNGTASVSPWSDLILAICNCSDLVLSVVILFKKYCIWISNQAKVRPLHFLSRIHRLLVISHFC